VITGTFCITWNLLSTSFVYLRHSSTVEALHILNVSCLNFVIVGDQSLRFGENGWHSVASKSLGWVVHDALEVVGSHCLAGLTFHVVAAHGSHCSVKVDGNELISVRSTLFVVESQGVHELVLNGGGGIGATFAEGQLLLATGATDVGETGARATIEDVNVITSGCFDLIEGDTVAQLGLEGGQRRSHSATNCRNVAANEIVEFIAGPFVRAVGGHGAELSGGRVVGKEEIACVTSEHHVTDLGDGSSLLWRTFGAELRRATALLSLRHGSQSHHTTEHSEQERS